MKNLKITKKDVKIAIIAMIVSVIAIVLAILLKFEVLKMKICYFQKNLQYGLY